MWALGSDPRPSGVCGPWDLIRGLLGGVGRGSQLWLWGAGPCSLLPRPRQVQPLVLLRHHQHFEEWHSRWLEDNVTVEAASLVQDWLMGEEDEDMVPCKTLCETVHVHGLPVNRYRVQYSRRPASP